MPDGPDLGEPQGAGKAEALTLIGCIIVAVAIVAIAYYCW